MSSALYVVGGIDKMDDLKGKSIGAAPWVDMGLKRLLVEAGIDLVRDQVKIAPVPGAQGAGVNFGVTAAKALEESAAARKRFGGMVGKEVIPIKEAVAKFRVAVDVRDSPDPDFQIIARCEALCGLRPSGAGPPCRRRAARWRGWTGCPPAPEYG